MSQRKLDVITHLHGCLALGGGLLQDLNNVQAAFSGLPHSSARYADRQGQEALGHVQESCAKLLLFFFAGYVRTSKD